MASRNVWIAVAVVIIVIIVGAGAYYWYSVLYRPGPTPNVTLPLYEGDRSTSSGLQGMFGLTQSSMTSPGPQLNFTKGDVVKVTVYNNASSTSPHNWAIVTSKSSTAPVVFGAQIGSGSNPIAPGSSGSVTFTVDQTGTFYYICQVPGHVDLGMWGLVVVTG